MKSLTPILGLVALALLLSASPAVAELPSEEGAIVTVHTLESTPEYPVLTRGRVLLIQAQRFVVTEEPLPAARVAEAPPEPQPDELERPNPAQPDALWVDGHWAYGPTGFTWVAGHYVAPRVGHAFVPPRWASVDGQHLYFNGFFVPRGVYVRSFFNRYYYSGTPNEQSRPSNGPYWPIGAPTRANSSLTSASVRDPYWPIGVRR
jgi:hypothetical protein